jgi:hypothetical protein
MVFTRRGGGSCGVVLAMSCKANIKGWPKFKAGMPVCVPLASLQPVARLPVGFLGYHQLFRVYGMPACHSERQ